MAVSLVSEDFFSKLIKIPQQISLGYRVTYTTTSMKLAVDLSATKAKSLRQVNAEKLSLQEQMLVKLLLHQPQKDNVYTIANEVCERVLFFLKDIAPDQVEEQRLKLAVKRKVPVAFKMELSRNNCRVNIDLSASKYDSLRDVPREDLAVSDRLFINFLSGIPISGGSFFVSQNLLAKMFYLVSFMDNVFYSNVNELVQVETGEFPYKLKFSDAGEVEVYFTGSKKPVLIPNGGLYLLGDKNKTVLYKRKIYFLPSVAQPIFTECFFGDGLYVGDSELPLFIAEYLPKLQGLGVNIELSAEAKQISSKVVDKPPVPLLEISRHAQGELFVEMAYDYGLAQNVLYDRASNDDFYHVEIEGEEYFLKRDKASEAWLDDFLQERRFEPAEGGYVIREDDFIDFYTYEYEGLNRNIGLVIAGESLEQFFYDEALGFDVNVNFREASGIDWFDFAPQYQVKGQTYTHQQIKDLLDENKDYLRSSDGTVVKVPQAEFEYLQKYLEGRKLNKKSGSFKVEKKDMYFLYESIRTDIKASVDNSLKELFDKLSDFKGIPDVPLPLDINGSPREYQHLGLNWLAFLQENSFHGILADDMGLGKTFQVLLLLAHLKEKKLKKGPSLIVAPTSVVYNWVAEIEKFTPNLKSLVLSGSRDRLLKVKNIQEYDIIITSYALLRNDLVHYKETNFYYMILDEAQAIKNQKSQIAKAVKCISSDYRLAMTGTPIENRLMELWSIFDFLMPGFLSSANYFRGFYESDLARLRSKVKPFILRRTKEQVLKDLPPKNEIDSFSELLPAQEVIYLNILNAQKKEIQELIKVHGVERSQLNILASLLKLRQICCHPALLGDRSAVAESAKFNQFKELVKEVLEHGDKVIVFSQFVQMLQLMKSYLDTEGIDYAYLDGSTKKRQEAIDEFNQSESKQIFLCSLKAGGLGINLTSANYVILYDPWWNPAVEQQAMDRVYRMGQKKEVFVYKLITKGTVEDKILKLQEKKRGLVAGVMDMDQSVGKAITKEDLEDLFSY